MFQKDLVMSVDYFGKLAGKLTPGDTKAHAYLAVFKANLEDGLEYYRGLVDSKPYPGENLASLKSAMQVQGQRLAQFWQDAQAKMGVASSQSTSVAKPA
jgi:hypothetical protein